MYHVERVIDGVLCWRDLPHDPWTAYTAKELTARLEESQAKVRVLEDDLESVIAGENV